TSSSPAEPPGPSGARSERRALGSPRDQLDDVELESPPPLELDEPPESPPLLEPELLAAGLWYRSVYQPAPFRMKLPPEIRRFALDAPHFGHTLAGSSEMRCSISHPAPHASQLYSYVGIVGGGG